MTLLLHRRDGLGRRGAYPSPGERLGPGAAGRPRAASVIDCPPEREAIGAAIRRALTLDCSSVVNPYDGGESSLHIAKTLRSVRLEDLRQKPFFLLDDA